MKDQDLGLRSMKSEIWKSLSGYMAHGHMGTRCQGWELRDFKCCITDSVLGLVGECMWIILRGTVQSIGHSSV